MRQACVGSLQIWVKDRWTVDWLISRGRGPSH
jgi:hypothetical protein